MADRYWARQRVEVKKRGYEHAPLSDERLDTLSPQIIPQETKRDDY